MKNIKYNFSIVTLSEIYLVSNTASYLFNEFKSESSLQAVVRETPTQKLIDDFVYITKTEIETVSDLVLAYAIYICIIIKDDNDAYNFMLSQTNIVFEWFGELRNIYLSTLKAVTFDEVNVEFKAKFENKIVDTSTSNINEIELC